MGKNEKIEGEKNYGNRMMEWPIRGRDEAKRRIEELNRESHTVGYEKKL